MNASAEGCWDRSTSQPLQFPPPRMDMDMMAEPAGIPIPRPPGQPMARNPFEKLRIPSMQVDQSIGGTNIQGYGYQYQYDPRGCPVATPHPDHPRLRVDIPAAMASPTISYDSLQMSFGNPSSSQPGHHTPIYLPLQHTLAQAQTNPGWDGFVSSSPPRTIEGNPEAMPANPAEQFVKCTTCSKIYAVADREIHMSRCHAGMVRYRSQMNLGSQMGADNTGAGRQYHQSPSPVTSPRRGSAAPFRVTSPQEGRGRTHGFSATSRSQLLGTGQARLMRTASTLAMREANSAHWSR